MNKLINYFYLPFIFIPFFIRSVNNGQINDHHFHGIYLMYNPEIFRFEKINNTFAGFSHAF